MNFLDLINVQCNADFVDGIYVLYAYTSLGIIKCRYREVFICKLYRRTTIQELFMNYKTHI